MWWIRNDKFIQWTRIKLRSALLKFMLLSICVTRGIKKLDEDKLNTFHRKKLKVVSGIKYPKKKIKQTPVQTMPWKTHSCPNSRSVMKIIWSYIEKKIWNPRKRWFDLILCRSGTKISRTPHKHFANGSQQRSKNLLIKDTKLTLSRDLHPVKGMARNRNKGKITCTEIKEVTEVPVSDNDGSENQIKSRSVKLWY